MILASSLRYFNPRSHEGSDIASPYNLISGYPFQSTLPRGERHSYRRSCVFCYRFQSTLPRGERRIYSSCYGIHWYFNPRSHEGSDSTKFSTLKYRSISIHAPTRGATRTSAGTDYRTGDFNPRSHEGSDTSMSGLEDGAINFNPRSHEGSDRKSISTPCKRYYFNPRSHEGSDTKSSTSSMDEVNFNPRSHEGSDSNFRQKVLFSLSKNCLKYLILTTNYFN